MPPQVSAIVHRTGTYRTATVEETWERVRPLLPRFAITRVADVTRLDEIGLPAHVTYRPVGRTIAVSIGIGLTTLQSRVSAVMESIESWHIENPRLEVVAHDSAAGLNLSYDPRRLQLARRSPLSVHTVLDWVEGRGILTGARQLVPYDTIALDFTRRHSWRNVYFRPSSNGVASGNSFAEATLHALHEIVERDCISPYVHTGLAERVYIDPSTSTHPDTKAILAAIVDAGCWVEVCELTNDIGIPCYGCTIWSEDVPMAFGGFGCHVSQDIAVGRSLAEAALSRMAAVSGARDDIDQDAYVVATQAPVPPTTISHPVAVLRPAPEPAGSIEEIVRSCAERVYAHTGVEPFTVDLTHADIGIPVSKVFAPGLSMMDERALGLRSGAPDAD